ncbi:Pre-mRNA-splicing regulator WTAP [Parasponia andersonii]|uniref:Pre-mRNA-splicing regulator WTAP n=1 Tax=Parasponia andersonii TaxID=3476 RepID=A0A2P5DG32_PARAD|nr:Pre-mRNA-splicing regulator WTAP [Parasponia andersonii]
MATHNHLDDVSPPNPFLTHFSSSIQFYIFRVPPQKYLGNKRNFGDLEDDEDDFFGSKKANSKVEETAPGVATGMILSLRESLQTCKDTLATYQTELDAAKSEIQKWHSSFQNESFIPMGTTPEPKQVINYLQTLKNSEESLREQLEKAKKKEAAFIVTFAKREQEIAELKSAVRDLKSQLKPPSMQARRLLLDPAIHEEFTRLKNLVEEKDKKVKELQDNIAAVQFTPQSKMGKMLMAKCRTLQEENEEIGNQAAEGKMHELAMKLALQKSQNAELRSQFEGLHKLMEGLTNDVGRSNEMEARNCVVDPMRNRTETSWEQTISPEYSTWVIVMKEKLDEKDLEIQRLRQELQQRSSTEEKTGSPSNHKTRTEMIPAEDDN